MNLVITLGVVGVIINWTLAIIGLPHQIIKNHRIKSVAGLSKINSSLLFISVLMNFLYGLSIANYPLILGNVLLLIFSFIILIQIGYYVVKERKIQR